jgi:hypothetical protein
MEEQHRVTTPFPPRPPPRGTRPLTQPPIWIDLPEKERTQLLGVLNRMLADRLADSAATREEDGHES